MVVGADPFANFFVIWIDWLFIFFPLDFENRMNQSLFFWDLDFGFKHVVLWFGKMSLFKIFPLDFRRDKLKCLLEVFSFYLRFNFFFKCLNFFLIFSNLVVHIIANFFFFGFFNKQMEFLVHGFVSTLLSF